MAALRAFVLLYPWVAAAHEGARFAYQLMYLLGRTPYYSPGLHLLRLQVVRLTGQEAVSGGSGDALGRYGGRAGRLRGRLLQQHRWSGVAGALIAPRVPPCPTTLQMQQERARQQRRADRLARLAGAGGGGGPWLWRLLRQGWARAGYAVADNTRSALILSVFAFKVRMRTGGSSSWQHQPCHDACVQSQPMPRTVHALDHAPIPHSPLRPAAAGVVVYLG